MRRARYLVLVLLLACLSDAPQGGLVIDAGGAPLAGVADRPPLGWDSWNSFGCDVSERSIEAGADALVASGMRAAGYRYVIVDDCWFDPLRDGAGRLRADPARFPHGMRALGDYLHARGLKFGIYSDPGTKTCAQQAGKYPGATGSGGHERLDAATFAGWGVDYLKYDWCSPSADIGAQARAFTAMRDALRATGRPIVYSINANSQLTDAIPGQRFDWSRVATMSRSTNDVGAFWSTAGNGIGAQGVADIAEANAGLATRAGPGHWNDPDMLETGVPGTLSPAEQRTQLTLWAMMAAPLIAGNDLTTATPATLAILTHRPMLTVDQDPLGRQARRIRPQIWVKPLSGKDIAVALYNSGDRPATISTTTAEASAPPASRYLLTDLWTGATSLTTGSITASVPPHDAVLLRVTPRP